MISRRSVKRGLILVAAMILAAAPCAEARAQSPDPDFFFSPPTLSVTLRAGVLDYQATGQLFDFTQREFTTEADEFRGGTLGLEIGVRMSERLELALGVDGGQVSVNHESRHWLEEDGAPIHQSTRVRMGPSAQLGLKGYLFPRGESLGQFAWIPTRANVFASGGVGVGAYEFRQFGDFVDDTADPAVIFADDFQSEGAALLMYAGGGGEVSLRKNLAITLEGRYHWAEDELEGDFSEFEPVNLNGLRITAGLTVKF